MVSVEVSFFEVVVSDELPFSEESIFSEDAVSFEVSLVLSVGLLLSVEEVSLLDVLSSEPLGVLLGELGFISGCC